MENKVFKQVVENPTIDVDLVTIEQGGKEYAITSMTQIDSSIETEVTEAVKLVVNGKLKAQKGRQVTITGARLTMTDNVFSPELVQVVQGGTINYEQVKTHLAESALEAGDYSIAVEEGYVNFTLEGDYEVGTTITYSNMDKVSLTSGDSEISIDFEYGETATGDILTTTSTTTENIVSYAPPTTEESMETEPFTTNVYSSVYDTSGIRQYYEKMSLPNCKGEPITFSSQYNVFRAPVYTITSAPSKGQSPYTITYTNKLPEVE